jgi:gluconolactonase
VYRNLRIPVTILAFGILMLSQLGAQETAGSNVKRIDPKLGAIVPEDLKVEKVDGNFQYIEGPAWVRKGGYLLFSDIPANAILKWTPGGSTSVYRKELYSGTYPKGVLIGPNGESVDRQGRLVVADHGNRRVIRFEQDGSITVLADRFDGKRLNAPNDLVVRKNGDIYFTDPTALERSYPADAKDKPQLELNFNGVYRIAKNGKISLVIKDLPFPNGLAFSPDEKKLYVANSRPEKYWMVYDVQPDGTVTNGKKFFDATNVAGDDVPDGMKVDTAGNVYATGPAGLMIFSPEGEFIGSIQFPELPSNCAWGDKDGRTLYVTGRTSLYRVRLKVKGIVP